MPFSTSLKDTRVLLTGGSGFIGSGLAKRLYREGADVSVIARSKASLSNLTNLENEAKIFESDVGDAESIREIIKIVQPQKVFHLAAYTNADRDFANIQESIRVNFEGTVNLLSALIDSEVDTILVSGSSEEYGNNKQPFDESMLLAPVSPYSASKATASIWSSMMHEAYGLPVVLIRPSLCYGPGQEPSRLIPQAIAAAITNRDFPMSGGEQSRDFIYIDDLVNGYILASLKKSAVGQIINFGGGEAYKCRDVIKLIFELTGSKGKPLIGALPYRPSEVWKSISNIKKAQRLLGWAPKVGLTKGLLSTIEAFQNKSLS
jgi:UDP-glucose 4-epimerase